MTHAPLNIVADTGAGDVLQTAIRHAPHPPPVKTFRTIAAVAAAVVTATSVRYDYRVSHVSLFLLGSALGYYQVQQFLGTRGRLNEGSSCLVSRGFSMESDVSEKAKSLAVISER